MSLLVPQSVERVVPEWFAQRLKGIDNALICYFNPIRERWIIDRCVRDDNQLHSDHRFCPKTNVKVIQDAQGSYMPLSDEVLDWFGKNDVGVQHKDANAFIKEMLAQDDAQRNKLKRERRDDVEHATRDNKSQILQMKHLIDQHGLDNCEADRIQKFKRAERRRKPQTKRVRTFEAG